MIWQNAAPEPPPTKGKHNVDRERRSIANLTEVGATLLALIRVLSQFRPQRIVDIVGRTWIALAYLDGEQVAIPTGQLCPYNASSGGVYRVGWTWGTINGHQPDGFSAGGLPAYTVTVSGTRYFFAEATFDSSSGLTTSAAIVDSDSPTMAATPTTAYTLIASCFINANGKLQVSGSCGNVTINFCQTSS